MNFYNMLLMCMGQQAATAGEEGAQGGGGGTWMIIIYIAIFGALIYFMMIRPSRRQKKQQEETQNAMEPGDSVLTTSGFYGTIVSVNGDTVIVEFGNNKNCRIPMAKQAISQVEKAGAASTAATSTDASPVKKFFGRRKAEEAPAQVPEQSSASESTSESSASSETSEESSGSSDKAE